MHRLVQFSIVFLRSAKIICLCSEFSKEALIDIERFQQQKISDLRETLTGYVILQIKMCRKVGLVICFLSLLILTLGITHWSSNFCKHYEIGGVLF
jgi:hypothetical protein